MISECGMGHLFYPRRGPVGFCIQQAGTLGQAVVSIEAGAAHAVQLLQVHGAIGGDGIGRQAAILYFANDEEGAIVPDGYYFYQLQRHPQAAFGHKGGGDARQQQGRKAGGGKFAGIVVVFGAGLVGLLQQGAVHTVQGVPAGAFYMRQGMGRGFAGAVNEAYQGRVGAQVYYVLKQGEVVAAFGAGSAYQHGGFGAAESTQQVGPEKAFHVGQVGGVQVQVAIGGGGG